MNKVLVIGPTYKSEVIQTKERLQNNNHFDCNYRNSLSGGSFSIACNLATFEVNTFFITRLALDEDGNRMLNTLDKKNIVTAFDSRSLSKTPNKTYLFADEDLKIFDDIPYNCYPSLEDNIPSEFLLNTDYILLNVQNNNFVSMLINRYQVSSKLICCNCIVSDDLLQYIEGIILDQEYLDSIVDNRNIDRFTAGLLANGLKYLLVVDKGKGVYIYSRNGNDYLGRDNCGQYYIGCYESFVAMFVASLSNNESFSTALNRAIQIENDFSYAKEFILNDEMF
ncbi:MAG: hypothetical protein ACI4WG_00820 [Erysipelotrichaceae bacterium]